MMERVLSTMTPRDRRALVVGGCLVAAGVVARLAPGAWHSLNERMAVSRTQAMIAGRTVQSARDLPRTQTALASVRALLVHYDSATVDGDGPASAGAELTDLVSTAASAAEAQITSMQLVPAAASHDDFGRVAARVSVTGDLEALAIMLEGLDAGPELVAIRSLNITQPETNLPPGRRETVRAEVEVEALYRPAVGARTP